MKKKVKDTFPAKRLREELTSNQTYPQSSRDSRDARVRIIEKSVEEFCLKVYFKDPEKEVLTINKILTGYPVRRRGFYLDPRQMSIGGVFIYGSDIKNIVKIETADEEEGGVLWISPELRDGNESISLTESI